MGAIFDRLVVTVLDARTFLGLPRVYEQAKFFIPAVVTEGDIFEIWVGNTAIRLVATGASTQASIVAAMIAGLITITGVTATNPVPGEILVNILTPGKQLSSSSTVDLIPLSQDDYVLDVLIDAAKSLADDYCNNPFAITDDDGVPITPEPIPPAVKMGVLQIMAAMYAQQNLGSSTSPAPSVGPIKRKKVGQVEIEYASAGDIAGSSGVAAEGAFAIPNLARNILALYRIRLSANLPGRSAVNGRSDLTTMADGVTSGNDPL